MFSRGIRREVHACLHYFSRSSPFDLPGAPNDFSVRQAHGAAARKRDAAIRAVRVAAILYLEQRARAEALALSPEWKRIRPSCRRGIRQRPALLFDVPSGAKKVGQANEPRLSRLGDDHDIRRQSCQRRSFELSETAGDNQQGVGMLAGECRTQARALWSARVVIVHVLMM
jgi:hypothetical protein